METAPPPAAYEYYALSDEDACEGSWIHRAGAALLTQPFEAAIASFLEFIGENTEADRTWIIGYNQSGTQFYNAHEWCRPGIASYVEDLQHTPVSMISWLHDRLVRKEAVMINAIDRLPRTARSLQAEFVRQKNRSVLSVPIFREGRILGIIGFDTVRAPRRWSPDIARTLFRCGSLIAAAWTRPETIATVPETAPAAQPVGQRPALIYLQQGGLVRGVALTEILAVSAEGDYTRVHLAPSVSTLELRPLKAWVSLLPKGDFQQVHRGALINVHEVESLERPTTGSWRVHLRGMPEPLNVSKAFRAEVRSRLGF